MLKNQEKKLVFNVSIISLVVSLLVCIPWGVSKVSGFELVMKYIIIPIFVIVASLINLSIKYRNYRPANKFATIASYIPMFTYFAASLFNALMYLVRSTEVYAKPQWVLMAVIISIVMVVFVVLSHFYYRVVIVFNKNKAMLLDYCFLAIAIIDTIALSFIGTDHLGVVLESGSAWHIVLPAIIGVLVLVLQAFVLRNYRDYNDEYKLVDKGPLLENWMKIREDLYYNATEEIMNALYIYSAEHLEFEDEEEEENPVEETKEEPQVIEVPADTSELEAKLAESEKKRLAAEEKASKAEKEKDAALARVAELEKEAAEREPEVVKDPELEAEVAKLQAENAQHQEEIAKRDEQDRLEAEQMAKLQEENAQHEEENAKLKEEIDRRDEQDRLEAEEKAAAEEAKQKAAAEKEAENASKYKALRPTYDKMCQYVDALEGVRGVPTSNGHKFYIGKKLVAIFQKGKADYRITFQASDDKFLTYIKDHSDCVSRATSPKGSNWLKFINKGVVEDQFVKDILKGAVDYVNAEIAAELAAKEEAKRIKAEEKRKAREAAKAAKKAEKENKAA